jgi:hypothetical protein
MLGAVALLATACSDSAIAPSQQRTLSHAPLMSRFDGSYTFTYNPSTGITTKLSVKNHTISIPANGVCDPALSSYGPGTWDDACPVLDHPISITVNSYSQADGTQPYLEFQPALRFVPDKVTILAFSMKKSTITNWSTILYCPTADACVNEALTDPSLATSRDDKGWVFRRIKHFSGYNVTLGIECDLSLGDPDCIDIGDGEGLWHGQLNSAGLHGISLDNLGDAGATDEIKKETGGKRKRRSGYMVVSGLEK